MQYMHGKTELDWSLTKEKSVLYPILWSNWSALQQVFSNFPESKRKGKQPGNCQMIKAKNGLLMGQSVDSIEDPCHGYPKLNAI